MKKWLAILCAVCFSIVTYNSALAANDSLQQLFLSSQHHVEATCKKYVINGEANFCSDFKSMALCECHAHHGGIACSNMTYLASAMLLHYGNSLSRACRDNDKNDPAGMQNCMENWCCYMSKFSKMGRSSACKAYMPYCWRTCNDKPYA